MINIWKRLLTILQARIENPEKAQEMAYAEKKRRERSFKWVKLLVILLIIALIIVGGYIFLFKIEVGASFRHNIGSWFSLGWRGLWQKIKDMERQVKGLGKWEAYISPEEKREKKGIEITKLSFQKPFLAGQDMFIFAEGEVHALKKSTTVEFKCFRDKKEGVIDKQTLYVEENIDIPLGVRCDFGQAPKVEGVKYSKVKFNAIYNDFETDSRLKLYTLSESKLEELKGINPFDYYEVPSEPTLDRKKRTTKADCGYGDTVCEPLMIDLRVLALQPFSDGEYTLVITVKNAPFWGGSLVKDRAGTLELEFFGNINPLDKTVFELSSEDQQTHYCDFTIQGAEDDISSVEIRAKAVYDYEFSKEATITIASKEAMAA